MLNLRNVLHKLSTVWTMQPVECVKETTLHCLRVTRISWGSDITEFTYGKLSRSVTIVLSDIFMLIHFLHFDFLKYKNGIIFSGELKNMYYSVKEKRRKRYKKWRKKKSWKVNWRINFMLLYFLSRYTVVASESQFIVNTL